MTRTRRLGGPATTSSTGRPGTRPRTEQVFRDAEVTVTQDMLYPRVHPAPLETCGIVADFDRVTGKLTIWATSQALHAHRTLYAMVTGLPEHRIRVISPDIGGGFGNKVPIYPGYLCAIVGSILVGRPVKWMEDRSENLMSGSFAGPAGCTTRATTRARCAWPWRWPVMELRKEQEAERSRGHLMGIGVSFFTEAVGAGPRKHMDILGFGMADGVELRIHPTGTAVVRISVQSQGQGHETTFAQIVAEELGLSPDDVEVVRVPR